MANKVYNLAGGLHSAAAYAGWENELFGGNAVASPTALKVGAGSGMTVSVGKGNALIDTGDDYSRRVALTEAVNVTLDQADTSLPRNDVVVIYVDMAISPVQTVQDNTNGILKVVAVKGTPASSPSDPDAGTIQQAIGAGNPYMTLASIRVNAGASAISSGNITDKRPASPNLYWTKPTQTAPYSSVITATSGTFSGQKTLATYSIRRSGTYLVAYQISVGSLGPATRGMLVELRKNNVAIPGTHMRNYMPGEGTGGAQQTMSCVWAGPLTAGQAISVAAMPESGQMAVQTGSLTVLEIPQLTNIN